MCGIILLVLRILDYNNIKKKNDKLIKGTSGWRTGKETDSNSQECEGLVPYCSKVNTDVKKINLQYVQFKLKTKTKSSLELTRFAAQI